MYKGMEQLISGEFTGFIIEAETKEGIVNQLINGDQKNSWYIVEEDSNSMVKKEWYYDRKTQTLESI